MNIKKLVAVAFLACVCVFGGSIQDIQADPLQKTVKVYTPVTEKDSFQGSGFFITPDLFITNYHVVSLINDVITVFPDGTTSKAKVVYKDRDHDLALVRSEKPSQGFFTISNFTPYSLDAVHSVGSYDNSNFQTYTGNILKTSVNVTVNYKNTDNTPYSLNTQFDLYSLFSHKGMSGSPVFNDKEEVVGVLDGHIEDSYTNKSIVVQLVDLKQFIAKGMVIANSPQLVKK